MAEQTPEISNVKLLAVAATLGLVVMGVYNFHIHQVRMEGRQGRVRLLRYGNDLEVQDRIGESDLSVVEVSRDMAQALGEVVREKDRELILGARVNKRVYKGDYVAYSDVRSAGGSRPSQTTRAPERIVTVEIDRRAAPGRLLRVGDRVDLVGILKLPGEEHPRAREIIPAALVADVAGQGGQEAMNSGRRGGSMPARYDQIQVVVDNEKEALLWENVKTWVIGSVLVHVRPADEDVPDDAGKVADELRRLHARPVSAGDGRSFDGP